MMKLKVFKSSVFILLMLALAACHPALPKDGSKASGIAFPESSEILSKWLRANVADFWVFARDHRLLADYPSTGVVVGDTHLANFAPIPVLLKSGATEMRYLDVDFDDAGRAPLALDFLRLVVTSRAVNSDVKIKELVAAYIKGLMGEDVAPPAAVSKYLNFTASDYRAMADEDFNGKTNDQGFKLKPGKIEAYNGPLTTGQLAPLLPQIKIIDLATRPHDTGGNAGARVWIYGKDASGLRRLFELKKYQRTSLDQYAQQDDARAWEADVRSKLWPEVAEGEYRLVSLAPNETYWLREKKLSLIDIPYSNKDKAAGKLVLALATYDSYILGRLHGQQTESAPLKTLLSGSVQQAAFLEAVKSAAKVYLNDVAQRL